MTLINTASFTHQKMPDPTPTFTSQSETTKALSVFEKFSKRCILKAFKQMEIGHLRLQDEDGIIHIFGSPKPEMKTANILVRNPQFFLKAALSGHVGIGESYCEGDWDTDDLEAVFAWAIANAHQSPLMESNESSYIKNLFKLNLYGIFNRFFHTLRRNSLLNSRTNIQAHYDLNNEFFACFLDPSMTYSSALFNQRSLTLEDAQMQKYQALCQKLRIKAGERILEIGTGWGGFACYAAKNYHCNVVTITLSQQQYNFACQRVKDSGLQNHITVLLLDYRHLNPDIHGLFDKVVSIEMIEAVGDAYYETYFKQCAKMLKPSGLLGLQMIICPDSRYQLIKNNVDFIQKHIFPGSLIPSLARINQATLTSSQLSLYELQDMGLDYAKTLSIWHKTFCENIEKVKELGFDSTFIRKWQYYLLYCKAAFSKRHLSVVQAIYTSPNNPTLMDPKPMERGR